MNANDCALVLVSDRRCIQPAKALMYAAHTVGQWQGAYVLLVSTDVSDDDMDWFSSRGVDVRRYPSIPNGPEATFLKFHLFRPEFRSWRRIVYLDCDMIIQRPMHSLAAIDCHDRLLADEEQYPLAGQFAEVQNASVYMRLTASYDLSKRSFNASSLIFDTSLIEETTSLNLLSLHAEYFTISRYFDQGSLNLLFYERWQQYPQNTIRYFRATGASDCIAVHCCHFRAPWLRKSPFRGLWQRNLESSEQVRNFSCPHA